MKKVLLLLASLTVVLIPFNAHSTEWLDLEQIDHIDEQHEGAELNEAELDGLLSAACNSSNSQSEAKVAREIKKEVSSSLSEDKLEVLTETALEIQELPNEEKSELCDIQ
ncbi:MAG: hypothetical protein QNJ72_18855 [Pleurocapsa sp. MO_226.B13]|nr:hypothetical protein [Pleurocapsa sp. MO_226.B13]